MPSLEGKDRVWRNLLIATGIGIVLVALTSDRLIGGAPGLGVFQLGLLVLGVAVFSLGIIAPRLAGNILLAAGSLAVGLAVAELLLRALFAEHLAGNLRPHPRYLFELTPSSTKYATRLRVNGGQSNLVHINSSGYRGDELRPRGAASRVVVAGDSYIEGEFSDLENTFVRRLQQKLVAAFARPIDVINAGVRAYGPDQISLRMEDELPRLKPDLLIVALYAGNDFGDLLRNKLYSLDPDGRPQVHSVTISDSLAAQFRLAEPGGSMLLKLLRKLLAPAPAEILPPDIAEQWSAQKDREYREALRGGARVLTTLADPYDIGVSTAPESPQALYQKGLLRAVVAKIRAAAATPACYCSSFRRRPMCAMTAATEVSTQRGFQPTVAQL